MERLRAEAIHTWFDLGLFIDRFKENREVPAVSFSGAFEDFLRFIKEGGIAFVSFFYSVDGVSIECEKYANSFRAMFKNIPIHYISGIFYENGEAYLLPDTQRLELPSIAGFANWRLYEPMFFQKLERGGDEYNRLIKELWEEVLSICEELGNYIEQNDIRLLYLVNTNSNPGNLSLALALVFISEMMGVLVISNNHDFYWEGGHSEIEREQQKLPPGPRDHFFTNYHLGEVFTLLELIYPWESRTWFSLNINPYQSD
ncbi:MAG: hypothetical protein D6732_17460, partial [Methanobacteriota archaeon]